MIEVKGKYCKDCKIFATIIEQDALQTIYDICDNPAFLDQKIRVMSDVHQGKGIVVGFSSTLGKYVCPSHIGVDIGCQVTSIILSAQLSPATYPVFDSRVQKTIPFGCELYERSVGDEKELLRIMDQELQNASSTWPDMIEYEPVNQKYIDKMLRRIGMDPGVFYKSLGTMGGSNHFIEYGEGLWNNKEVGVLSIHSGSRNFGLRVCKFWETKAGKPKITDTSGYAKELVQIRQETKNKKEIPGKIEELKKKYLSMQAPPGYLEGEELKGYLKDMVIATAYAKYNHKVMSSRLLEIYKKLVPGAKVIETINTMHNYINFQDHIIRKGAVQAKKDQLLILPFNMKEGLAICRGLGNDDWNNTCPHGAGRIMSRNKAKEKLSLDDYKQDMQEVYSTCVKESTIDESPRAYKDKDEIIEQINPSVEIITFIKPKINFKAS